MLPTSLLPALKRYWGYDTLRPPQAAVVEALLAGEDALIVLPTGYGKSLCFQLPAILQTGLTLVITPLVALMEDQAGDLHRRGLPAAALHSQLPAYVRRRVLERLPQLRLLYLSPETLLSPAVWSRLPGLKLNGLIIDEAHTLVQWGESFRPDYRRLGTVRAALGQSFAIATFTATANPRTLATLTSVLQLQSPRQITVAPARPNIRIQIQTVWTPWQRQQQMRQLIRAQKSTTGLIFVRTRQAAETIANQLQQHGFQTAAYHGGLGASERRRLEGAWLNGELPFIVTTNAFGMGINKPDVRWILHLSPPPNLTDYLQEIGRAGRDGQTALALMLVTPVWLDASDEQQAQWRSRQARQHYQAAQTLLRQLPQRGHYDTTIEHFGATAKLSLALLHQAGAITWHDPFHFERLNLTTLPTPTDLGTEMQAFIATRTCRWQYLLQAFGFAADSPCGTCDRCRR